MSRETTQQVLERLLQRGRPLSTRDVADAARVSRQMAQRLLKALVDEGRLTIEGRARAARYQPVTVDDSLPPPPPRSALGPASWIAGSLPGGRAEVDDSVDAPVDDFEGPRVDDSRATPSAPVDDSAEAKFRRAAQRWDTGSPYAILE